MVWIFRSIDLNNQLRYRKTCLTYQGQNKYCDHSPPPEGWQIKDLTGWSNKTPASVFKIIRLN